MPRLLIIEDEEPLRNAFALLLSRSGYEIELAENGQVALEKLKSSLPDLIILDLVMPVMDGKEFLKHAKFSKASPKVLIMSNLSDPLNIEQFKKYGVSQTVVKSEISPTQLVKLIEKTLA